MVERSIVVIGLPESGKTTFLAALWHLVTQQEVDTVLCFDTLAGVKADHLNEIAARWREARIQDRTALGGKRLVSMNLKDAEGLAHRVTFPDLPGEAFRRMWEDRECEPEMGEFLRGRDVLFFIHSDTIQSPRWVVEEVSLTKELGLEAVEDQAVPWHPSLAPTQVQLVDLLQLLRRPPLDTGTRRVAVMLSAWDKASDEGLKPDEYLKEKLPLLNQYLQSRADGWDWRVYGLSAQGGDYDPTDATANPVPEADVLRSLDTPSERIRLVEDGVQTNDLTRPLAWLME